ncbi:MAG: hypothetical protein AMXMBFR64_58560 [Myxococcales bacterium]
MITSTTKSVRSGGPLRLIRHISAILAVAALGLLPSLATAANPPECSYYTKKQLEMCSNPALQCTWYETQILAPSCEGMPKAGCCSGDYRVFCNEEGSTLCAADCTNYWSPGPCKKSLSGPAECAGLPIQPGDPLDCAVVPACACGEQECGVGPCLKDCGACPSDRPVCTFDGKCVECAPKCDGKACGPDGCGGPCGPCPTGQVCVETTGACCTPDCAGKSCGPDGCGGSCGSCGGAVCTPEGSCAPLGPGCTSGSGAGCGCDCEGCVCEEDPFCCAVTWDALCSVECATCGAACPQAACVPNCAGAVCGDHDGCGGSCGSCPPGTFCGKNGGKCLPCTCENRECGDDGCGHPCGSCLGPKSCYKGQCVQRGCTEAPGAGCDGCPCEDCVCALDPYCCDVQWDSLCAQHCTMQCGVACPCIQVCGDRECGTAQCDFNPHDASYTKFCGTCPKPEVCMPDGWCCAPSCEGKECGSDGCYDFCGECGPNEVCAEGNCVCIPTCWGKECGSNDCGDPDGCGVCPSGEFCAEGTCVPPYPASCLGLERSSAPDCPDGLSEAGCCDGAGRAVWCSEGRLYCEDCPSCSQVCGSAPQDGDSPPPSSGAQRCVLPELRTTGAPSLACTGCWAGCPAGTRCEGGQCVAPDDVAGGDVGVADGGSGDLDAAAPGDGGTSMDVAPGADGGSTDQDAAVLIDAGSPMDASPNADGAPLPSDAAADTATPSDAPGSAADAPPATETAPVPDAASPASDAAPDDVSGSCGGCRASGGPPLALLGLLLLAVARRKRERPAPEHLDA